MRTWSQFACLMVTRTTGGLLVHCIAGASVQRCDGATIADGKPPSVSSSESAGGDRHN
jgi:hypothetical protein